MAEIKIYNLYENNDDDDINLENIMTDLEKDQEMTDIHGGLLYTEKLYAEKLYVEKLGGLDLLK